jgi:hypothetical protein
VLLLAPTRLFNGKSINTLNQKKPEHYIDNVIDSDNNGAGHSFQ